MGVGANLAGGEGEPSGVTARRGPASAQFVPKSGRTAIPKRWVVTRLFGGANEIGLGTQDRAGAGRRVRALKAMVSRQQTIMVPNTPDQPQRSAIQPTPVPAMAEPKT